MATQAIIGGVCYWKHDKDDPQEQTENEAIEINSDAYADTGRIEIGMPLKGATVYLRVDPQELHAALLRLFLKE